MPRVLIVADDLSGAADCGIACTVAGLATSVLLDGDASSAGAEAIAIDADTRWRPRDEAARETARLAARHADGAILFKKLDSTLRGHWPEEIAALRGLRPGAPVVLAPAFPGTGRTTIGGRPYLAGQPLEETEIGRRENLSAGVTVADMLRRAGLNGQTVRLDQIRSRDFAFAAMRDAIFVCDAETEDDLSRIAQAAAALGPETIWAGSAGLARHLPAAFGFTGTAAPFALPELRGPLLFAIGSVSHVSREQARRLASLPDVASVTVPPDILRGKADGRDVLQAIETALDQGHDLAVLIGAEGEVDLSEGYALAKALAAFLAPYAPRIGGLFATGGETARALLTVFDRRELFLVGEVEPGVPVSLAGPARDLPVITKAGAFGTPETLLHCRDMFRAASIGRPAKGEENP